jgi:uncharacterized repeat protein (TIGR03803 family)
MSSCLPVFVRTAGIALMGLAVIWGDAASAAGRTVFSFDYLATGQEPQGTMSRSSDGRLYGVTRAGGAYGSGTVYAATADGRVDTLHMFAMDLIDGGFPAAAPVEGGDGFLYGTTYVGGAWGVGTIYRLSRNGAFETTHAFDYHKEGSYPASGLLLADDGRLYGTTTNGSPDAAYGSIFRFDPATAMVTTLHGFVDDRDGAAPSAAPIQGSDGALYGTTMFGGRSDAGTIYRISLDGSFSVLHHFDFADGAYPRAELLQTSDGWLYGVAYNGGTSETCINRCGVLFRLRPDGSRFVVLHSFGSMAGEPTLPAAPLILATDGWVYGTTAAGGGYGYGAVFRFDPRAGRMPAIVRRFTGADFEGARTYSPVIEVAPGVLVGNTAYGGDQGMGTLFVLRPR